MVLILLNLIFFCMYGTCWLGSRRPIEVAEKLCKAMPKIHGSQTLELMQINPEVRASLVKGREKATYYGTRIHELTRRAGMRGRR